MNEWHYTIEAFCNEHYKPIPQKLPKLKDGSIQMIPFSRVNGIFLFRCPECNRILKVKSEEVDGT